MKMRLILAAPLILAAQICLADLGHESDAKKVEVEVFNHTAMQGADDWVILNGEIYNPFSVPITMRDVRGSAGDIKVERSVTVFGNTVWTELKLLQIAGGELLLFDGEKLRMSTNAPMTQGEMLQIGIDFGPIGWKSYFYNITDQTKP
jgi:hypothetical protein